MSTSLTSLAQIEQDLTTAIGQQETNSGTAGVGASLNNIGGLNYANWEAAYGATPTPGSPFATFPTLSASNSALTQLLDNYIQSGASIQSLMNSYAPVGQNPTTPARITSLAGLTGLNPTQPILQQVSGSAGTTASTSTNPVTAATTAASTIANVASSAAGWLNPARIAAVVVGVILFFEGLSHLFGTPSPTVVISQAGKKAASGLAAAPEEALAAV